MVINTPDVGGRWASDAHDCNQQEERVSLGWPGGGGKNYCLCAAGDQTVLQREVGKMPSPSFNQIPRQTEEEKSKNISNHHLVYRTRYALGIVLRDWHDYRV